MFTRILVPFDGSELAQQALVWAERLASQESTEIFLLQVVDPLGSAFAARPTATLLAAEARERDRELKAATTALSNQVHALHGRGLLASRYVQVGKAGLKILEFIHSHHVDLVIMGTHGLGGFQRAVLGSVADEVRREAGVPVLVIPNGAPRPLGKLRLLACIDESVESESVLAAVLEFRQNVPAAITVLEVVPDTQGSAVYREASAHLARLAQSVRTPGTCLSTAVSRGDPAREIVSMAGVLNANVIALASHGRSGIARAVLGSVASQVITVSQTPVLLTPRAIPTARGNADRALSVATV